MNATVGVFDTHEKAVAALRILKNEGVSMKNISLVGKAEITDDEMKIQHHDPIVKAPVGVGVAIGAAMGILSGVGLFVLPGLGFLYGAGAVVGALAGMDMGLIGGGAVSVLASLGLKKEDAIKYHEHLKEGKFLLIFNGPEEEEKQVEEIFKAHANEINA